MVSLKKYDAEHTGLESVSMDLIPVFALNTIIQKDLQWFQFY